MISTTSIMGIVVLFFLMGFMAILYLKLRVFLVILIVYVFSLMIGINSLQDYSIPFSPNLQILFLLYQSLFFLLTTFKLLNK